MKKAMFCLLSLVVFCLPALGMIDSYNFKIIGRIDEVQPQKDADTLLAGIISPRIMKVDVISIIPAETDSSSWFGRHKLVGPQEMQVTIKHGVDLDIDQFKTGDLVVGEVMVMEVEQHGSGYRITRDLAVEDKLTDQEAAGYIKNSIEQIAPLVNSPNAPTAMNVVLVAHEFGLTVPGPISGQARKNLENFGVKVDDIVVGQARPRPCGGH
ncbi:MAG: hypothetical protein KKH83_06430 [Candidatus Margulisbacteria bacterium]|nr:hypothetical protein [Candidatus Margulisiibacteriota bacterium]